MRPDTSVPAISMREVFKTYPGSAAAVVNGLSLDVPTGEIVALVGPSGCGKTTTLKMINRLIEPTSGSIDVLGRPQDELPAHELRRHIGYVIQQVGLFPHLTIERNIGVVPDLLGWDKKRARARSRELAELVGLEPDMLGRYPAALSGGQQQRVGVARALAADPPILLMDEPFSAVDPIVRERLQDDLLALQAQVGKTIVIVTHDVDEAIKLSDRVALMEVGGRLAQYDTPNAVLRSPANEFVVEFLGRERSLRRLSLLTVGDVVPSDGPAVDATATAADAVKVAQSFDSPWILIKGDERLVGRLTVDSLEDLDPDTVVGDVPMDSAGPTVESATSLREALDAIVADRAHHVAVVDDSGRLAGFVSLDDVTSGLAA